ncbi:response regulator [Mucilaginibacter sp. UR6-11]|uniref:response regulator n=1 Tax=Mucilaginibacter sp. UR6-11 TaxID=1435644 RepID=UPI001E48BF3F|nr:response regulator [Mucilaginibacter sp. UR6-11]MCC8426422.1 response regulator [Mucilaginibacter sp. UR6-11]
MKKILLIEDNEDIRENTCELLELEGYQVITADDGEIGVTRAKEVIADLILCDVLMPGTNGYEVFEALRSDPRTADTPFVFLTANAERTEMKKGLDLGANAYIRKPFEPEELFAVIAQCLPSE